MIDTDYLNDFNDFIYNEKQVPSSNEEKDAFFKKLKEKFYAELANSEVTQNYFRRFFNNGSPESFLQVYTQKKVHLIRYYKYYVRLYNKNEINELKYQKEAEDALAAILHKKLFNLQLKWRANQIKLAEVDTSYDFEYWGDRVSDCPFIDLVTSHELALMKEFLLNSVDSDDKSPFGYDHGWQDYEELTEKGDHGDYENMPEWYQFYDNRMGTGSLLLLPDLRGPLEEKYIRLAIDHNQKKNNPEGQKTTFIPDERPSLIPYGQPLVDFSRVVETDKHLIKLFEFWEHDIKAKENSPDEFELEEALELFRYADRPIHFESHLNWHEAIFRAAYRYENLKIVEAIDFVYDQYLMLKELGVTTTGEGEDSIEVDVTGHFRKVRRETILKGRELCGEPRDFNF
jgi:hypothetical protein